MVGGVVIYRPKIDVVALLRSDDQNIGGPRRFGPRKAGQNVLRLRKIHGGWNGELGP
jgi:hypothetical protein